MDPILREVPYKEPLVRNIISFSEHRHNKQLTNDIRYYRSGEYATQ